MIHTSRNPLDTFVFQIKDIDWTDAPTLVVTVLPVVHAIFPPFFVVSPPFSCDVAVLQSPFRNAKSIALAAEVIDTPRG